MLNYYMIYKFVRLLTSPFNKWDAFKTGVIDDKGNIITHDKDRTNQQKQSLTKFEVLVLNLKKILSKLPGGTSRIGSFSAALYLLKEHDMFLEGKSYITESEISEIDFDSVGRYVTEMVTSAGTIDSEGFMSVENQKKWKRRNAESFK